MIHSFFRVPIPAAPAVAPAFPGLTSAPFKDYEDESGALYDEEEDSDGFTAKEMAELINATGGTVPLSLLQYTAQTQEYEWQGSCADVALQKSQKKMRRTWMSTVRGLWMSPKMS